VTVKNEGNFATEDVLQIYIKDEKSGCDVLNHRLCAFKRVSLAAGEEKQVEIDLAPRSFTTVDDNGERAIRSNTFTIYAGFSQPDARSAALTGNKAVSYTFTDM
jgi:beta-glucosidase